MTAVPGDRAGGQPDADDGAPATEAGSWTALRPELVITFIMVISTAVAAYSYAGFAAAFATLTAWAVVLFVLIRALVQVTPAKPGSQDEDRQLRGQSGYIGFWRKRGVLVDAAINMRSYDADLRPTLQHLLAARLAERHGVSLYADPEAARRLLLAGERDDGLWYWLDPERPAEQRSTRQGIPQRTLTAIIDRLERL
jgi:hypothetical protein